MKIECAKKHPVCLGTGFVSLDIVKGQRGDFAAAGGSCGNVMTILAWLGWSSTPAARLGADPAGNFLTQELTEEGLDTTYVSNEKKVASPIVIHKFVETTDGDRSHRFSLSCPDCGTWLPRFRSMTLGQADHVAATAPRPNVFYFDRVSPASLKLAEWARNRGALIVFEPSGIGDERAIQRAVDVCHVLKYSNERLGHVPDLAAATAPRLIIETFGGAGLRVRWRSRWSTLTAFKAPRFVDAAGSGDWCSAGLIHQLGQRGAVELDQIRKPQLESALRFGQALAAINCAFEGARGAMMALTHGEINRVLQKLESNQDSELPDWKSVDHQNHPLPRNLCGSCTFRTTSSGRKKHA